MRHVSRLTLAVLLASSSIATATDRLPGLTIDQLTRRASTILEGQVTDVHGEWNAGNTQIRTVVTVQVSQYYKGDLGQPSLQLRFLGGAVGDMSLAIAGQSNFQLSERVFLFLESNYDVRFLPCVGGDEGSFEITTDGLGADILVGPTQTYDKIAVINQIQAILQAAGM
jgi:hypothetical protein